MAAAEHGACQPAPVDVREAVRRGAAERVGDVNHRCRWRQEAHRRAHVRVHVQDRRAFCEQQGVGQHVDSILEGARGVVTTGRFQMDLTKGTVRIDTTTHALHALAHV